MSKRAVFAIAQTQELAADIVDELRAEGFRSRDISVLFPDEAKRRASKLDESGVYETIPTESRAPEGAAIGASAGSAIGGTLGLLAGIGALAIPGVGPFIAAGPIMATLGGLGVGAAVGGITGALVGVGIPEQHARKYETLVANGGILMAVHGDLASDLRHAARVFERYGATNVMTSYESPEPSRAATTQPDLKRRPFGR